MTTNPGSPSLETVKANSTVYIVDDEDFILDLVRRACERKQFQARTFTDPDDFLNEITPESPGCVVLDYKFEDGMGNVRTTGLEVLQKMTERGLTLPVIFVSGNADLQVAVQAFRMGSLHFLEKPFQIDQLQAEIEKAIVQDAQQRERAMLWKSIDGRVHSLTHREKEVAELVVAGHANKATAAQLGVSHKTIEVHRAAVMRKMEADSLAELVQMWLFHESGPEGAPQHPGEHAEDTHQQPHANPGGHTPGAILGSPQAFRSNQDQ